MALGSPHSRPPGSVTCSASASPLARSRTPIGADGDDDTAHAMGEYLAMLPPERFPHLLAASGELATGDADQRFEFGLDLLIRVLASMAPDGQVDG